jgi:hypothetical protein
MPFGYGLPRNFKYPDYDTTTVIDKSTGAKTGPIPSYSTIMPGKDIKTFGYVNVEWVRRARNKEINLYIYGHVDYIDVFGKSWVTEYCYLYMPNWSGEGESFTTYHEHNNST